MQTPEEVFWEDVDFLLDSLVTVYNLPEELLQTTNELITRAKYARTCPSFLAWDGLLCDNDDELS